MTNKKMTVTAALLTLTFFCFSAMARRPAATEPAQPPLLTLQDCYGLALERSETVAIAKEDIEEAEAQVFLAASEGLGDIDFIMEHSRRDIQKGGGESSVGGSFTDPDTRTRRFVITQPLFQGFRAVSALTGAGSLKKQQREEWIRAKQLLFLDVVRGFYGFLRQKKELEIVEGVRALFQERIRELEEREQIGRSRPSEVATARARLKIVEADQASLAGAAQAARHVLEFLTGIEISGREFKEEAIFEGPFQDGDYYLEFVESRPDVEASEQAVKTAWRGVLIEQSELWPDLSVEHTQYERRENFQSNLDWEFLFKINVPLFRGGETIGNIKQAVSVWKKEKLAYSLAQRQAELEIKQSYDEWIASRNNSAALEEALRASEENFRLQKEDYNRNLVGNLDVLAALESLHETQRSANQAHYAMRENYWRLQTAIGEVP